jgi:L-seryl-tRNA(Ser) seleniumtransferase
MNGRLRSIPSVDSLLSDVRTRPLLEAYPRELIVEQMRAVLDDARRSADDDPVAREDLVDALAVRVAAMVEPAPRAVVNATGVVLHTNLGRALLAAPAVEALANVAGNPCDLEIDLETGSRGSRDQRCATNLVALTGAESATVVNNNAAAVVLAVGALARGRDVIVSRGELVEIGGSFRIPEIIASSGARLREVGTTNRTHLRDYADAIGPDTGLLLKVHPSNYEIGGFTSSVTLAELVELGRSRGVPVVEDLGSGALIDLSRYGLPREPLVGDSVRTGADAVTFSGDKLLGGPQAGMVVGRREAVERMKTNPLKRALRCDKLVLAALDATLRLYRTSNALERELPTLRYLTRKADEIEAIATTAAALLRDSLGDAYAVTVESCDSQIGSGAQPTATIASHAVVISHPEHPPQAIAARFRAAHPAIVGRVHQDRFWLDCRCVDEARHLVPNPEPRSPFPET